MTADEIGDVVEYPAYKTFVGGEQRPYANDPDAIEPLNLIEPVAIARIDLAAGVIGRAR